MEEDTDRLFSGAQDDLDRAIVYSVAVPNSGDKKLAVTMEWGTELGWDFGFVQVWDPATKSWKTSRTIRASRRPRLTRARSRPSWRTCRASPVPGLTGTSSAGRRT